MLKINEPIARAASSELTKGPGASVVSSLFMEAIRMLSGAVVTSRGDWVELTL